MLPTCYQSVRIHLFGPVDFESSRLSLRAQNEISMLLVLSGHCDQIMIGRNDVEKWLKSISSEYFVQHACTTSLAS